MKLLRLPIFPLSLGVLALAMLGPAMFGLIQGDEYSARSFLYTAIFTGFASATLAVALGSRDRAARGELPHGETDHLTNMCIIVDNKNVLAQGAVSSACFLRKLCK